MIIRSLNLENYRNYSSLNLELNAGTNIFYGDNAQGKTNILEAVYLCAASRSHRGCKDKEMIRFGEEEAHIKVILEKKGSPYRIDIHLKNNKTKGIAINGIPIKKVVELLGILNAVFFSPEDLDIIKRGPGERRRFIDMELCQLDKIYAYHLMNYNKALYNKNQLLKDARSGKIKDMDLLDIWDMKLAEFGSEVIKRREKFVKQIDGIIRPIHSDLTEGREQLEVYYEPNVREDIFYNKLAGQRTQDIRMGTSSIGPQRDDMSFILNQVDVRKYGSQGQQRTTALSLKLAEIELVKKINNDTPILLLDDVFSELDQNRQKKLLQSLKDIQTFITCTGLDEFVHQCFHIDQAFRVVNGSVLAE